MCTHCRLEMICKPLSGIIHTTKASLAGSGIPFFDLSFQTLSKDDFRGPGIYGVFFTPDAESLGTSDNCDERLIYIGKYRGERHNPFGGDAARKRWWTHMGSMTLRSNKISIARKTIGALPSLEEFPKSILLQDLVKLQTKELHIDKGCGAGFNRVRFAAKYWRMFEPAVAMTDLLLPFRICYLRVRSMPEGMTRDQLRQGIGRIEKSLIASLKPICNYETTWDSTREDVTKNDFVAKAQERLATLWRNRPRCGEDDGLGVADKLVFDTGGDRGRRPD